MTPRIYDLATLAITAALTNQAQSWITNLDGMSAADIVCEMLGGSGGTSIAAIVQTSFDGGTTPLDIARFDFLATPGKKYCNLQTIAAKAITAYAALAVEGVNDGLLGDRLRVTLTTVGIYTNTTLNIRAHVRP